MIGERANANPVTAEIIRNALIAITDEMKSNLMRTAYNSIIYEALDYTVGLFDADGNTISIGLGLPMFIRGLSDCIKAKLDHYGAGGIYPGDIILTNDAYITGSHLNHLVFTLPIFVEDRLVAFASTMAHWQDIGGSLAGQTRDIFSEGLQIPIVKFFKAGVQDVELTEIIRTNVRLPELAMGDLRAQLAAIRTGERRFIALAQRYGVGTVLACMAALDAHSERVARDAVSEIPDGIYEASSFMDDDGVTSDRLEIGVRVIVRGDTMTIDLSNVNPQVAGYFNSGATAGRSAAQVAFKCLTTPTTYPINDGAFRPLEIVLPPGRVVSALKPAAMRRWMTIPMTVVDTIFKAVADAIPERTIAGHHADLCNPHFYGLNPKDGRFFYRMLMPGGGWGAKFNEDGVSATVAINDGDTHNSPIEAAEAKIPIRIERYGLRTDSGGPGEFRGGLGVELRFRALCPIRINIHTERTQCAPWGLHGGLPALANRVIIERADGRREMRRNGKLDAEPLAENDVLITESGGGGGFGDPRGRDRAAVRADIRNGYVSIEAAARDYGLT